MDGTMDAPAPPTVAGVRLPDTVVIAGLPFAVVVDENLPGQDRDDNVLGVVRMSWQKIYINPNQGPECAVLTLLHEVTHQMLDSVGYGGINNEEHERLTETLSRVLFDTLRRNPELVRVIMETGTAQ
jgi:hypothetical protein